MFLVPEAPQARIALGKAGVANFYTPEACADAVAAALGRRPPRPQVAAASAPMPQFAAAHSGASIRLLDELQSYDVVDRLGVPRAPSLAIAIDRPLAPDLPFPYPVAVKALSERSRTNPIPAGWRSALPMLRH